MLIENRERVLLLLLIGLYVFVGAPRVQAQTSTELDAADMSGTYLYRVALIQAAPGKYREAIAFQKGQFAEMEERGESRPFRMRHSQGDRWDFLIIYPMKSYRSYFDRTEGVDAAESGFIAISEEESALTARHEDLFVRGPNWETLEPVLRENRFFHIEMFTALPGKRKELLGQRRMENEFIRGIDRPTNFIFERDAGGGVDAFTLGCYRDIKHFAESADTPADLEETAAINAGFEGVGGISPYLRSLIAEHHDTLAVAID